ncbi:7-hydroxymethyl chlorophyll a reductase, chloroplastic [Symbiodinium microadriaticum]|uniref:7-hydroxymethyl chlorophyll a reductase, chloroplastic n=1 Tax=Symbiodinium microadriaticum TaxID=2951 RepID=A0A1Q9F3Z6_SYMMI|nr:7-hydroxymethyl chlorophyll a reductase, chloroplastic [Symbiodinium microadriaticum]
MWLRMAGCSHFHGGPARDALDMCPDTVDTWGPHILNPGSASTTLRDTGKAALGLFQGFGECELYSQLERIEELQPGTARRLKDAVRGLAGGEPPDDEGPVVARRRQWPVRFGLVLVAVALAIALGCWMQAAGFLTPYPEGPYILLVNDYCTHDVPRILIYHQRKRSWRRQLHRTARLAVRQKPRSKPMPAEQKVYPAKDLCSRCGFCNTSLVGRVQEACAFLGEGMERIDALEEKVHGRRRRVDEENELYFGVTEENGLRPIRIAPESRPDRRAWTGVVTSIACEMLRSGRVDAVLCVGSSSPEDWL